MKKVNKKISLEKEWEENINRLDDLQKNNLVKMNLLCLA